MPLAPPGTKVTTNGNTEKRVSWSLHLITRCYIIIERYQYRRHILVVENTSTEQVSNTMNFYPKMFKIPTNQTSNTTTHMVETHAWTLQVLHQDDPFHIFKDKHQPTLANLAEFFKVKSPKALRVLNSTDMHRTVTPLPRQVTTR